MALECIMADLSGGLPAWPEHEVDTWQSSSGRGQRCIGPKQATRETEPARDWARG